MVTLPSDGSGRLYSNDPPHRRPRSVLHKADARVQRQHVDDGQDGHVRRVKEQRRRQN